MNQGPGLEEDIPDPEELDWWSKYYASLQELQGQVRAEVGLEGGGLEAEKGKWQEEASHQTWTSTLFQSSLCQPSFLFFIFHHL